MSGWKAARILGGLALAGLGGFLVAASGIVPIKASSGHWPITEWFLHFSMQRSVSLHSLGTKTPPLDDPALVLRGAGHYGIGCQPCHGSPGHERPAIPRAMTPHPPYLPPRIHEWEPRELFYIVKHGVKLTGMPAWPVRHRDDEVWAVVAFLLALPELDPAAYRALTGAEAGAEGALDLPLAHDGAGPRRAPTAVYDSCARCHGVAGHARGVGAFPKLAGQSAAYLAASLRAYAEGERHSGIMEPVARALDPDEIAELARHYAAQAPRARSVPVPFEDATVARGAAIARDGIPARGVPACADCHGRTGEPVNRGYPRLAGQDEDYLLLQLVLFKEGRRGGTPYAHLMEEVVDRMERDDMMAAAAYYASLP